MVTRLDHRRDESCHQWWRQASAAGWLAAEAECCRALLGPLEPYQVLELAPQSMPSLELTAASLHFSQHAECWQGPVYSALYPLPIVSNSLDVVIWRYLELNPGDRNALIAELHRCLRPGGQLLLASLNPLQPSCWRACRWRQLGRQALGLSWPLMLQGFRAQTSCRVGGSRLLRPVRLLLLRKPGDPRNILRLKKPLLKSVDRRQPGTLPSCRAA